MYLVLASSGFILPVAAHGVLASVSGKANEGACDKERFKVLGAPLPAVTRPFKADTGLGPMESEVRLPRVLQRHGIKRSMREPFRASWPYGIKLSLSRLFYG